MDALPADKYPPVEDFPRLSEPDRAARLLGTYSYVRLRQATRQPVSVDLRTWREVLAHNEATLSFRELFELVPILQAGRAYDTDLAGVGRRLADLRLADLRLDDGTIGYPSSYTGDPEASFFVLSLRSLAGEPTVDAALVAALTGPDIAQRVGADPATKLTADAAYSLARSAGERTATAESTQTCANPATVDLDSVIAWQRTALHCAALKQPMTAAAVRPWPVGDAQGVVAAARLVNGVTDAGLPVTARWILPANLAQFALRSDDLGGVGNYAEVLRAFLTLGSQLTDAQLTEADRIFQAAKGCPRLPDLYRIGAGDKGCDLGTTLSVWKLSAQLGRRYGR